ncbi:Leukocyte receptor cluster member 1 [Fasciola hepatica]|uniref:Leukocyte receptor cluster member 1 n=1 Tax=Fasciola hepatica TaxID=6192 RepID=A0A4E0R074_FASHE|nr:Leukocyte receptor cluster member 1 [Fasciola hepatica]
MNILPKKRWHVRTKENIARVRKDEAEFEEKKLQDEFRSLIADQEARTEALRKHSRSSLGVPSGHTIEKHSVLLSDRSTSLIQGNKEYEAEKKSEKEAAEKSIGLLTYLGQSLVDSGGQKPWYDLHPKRLRKDEEEKLKTKEEWEAKKKLRADPLVQMNKVSEWFEKKREEKSMEEAKLLRRAESCIAAMPELFPNDISVPSKSQSKCMNSSLSMTSMVDSPGEDKKTKHKRKHKHRSHSHKSTQSSSCSSEEVISEHVQPTPGPSSAAIELAKRLSMDKLRAERLQRERKERERAALVLAKARGLSQAFAEPAQPVVPTDEREIPFNSAFNPELSAALAARRKRDREARRRPHH